MQNGIEKDDEEKILEILKDTKIEYVKKSVYGKILTSIILDGKDITEEIHRVDIAQVASDISKIVKVREYMVDLQRKIANEYVKSGEDVLLEGRDICTVIFPDADLKILEDTKIEYVKNSVNGKMLTSIILDGKDITEEIHRVDIAQVASDISKIVKVREYMVDLQRKIANEYVKMDEDVLLEGRDICTVVFPDADLKIYLDADTNIRAKRRLEELKNRGINENLNLEEMIKSIEKRDETDKNKTVGALKRTENQKYIDTTDKKIDDVITEILGEIERIRKENVR